MIDYPPVFKRVWDEKPIDVSWNVPEGVSIISCTVSANVFVPPRWEGEDVSGELLISPIASFIGGTASATTQAGTNKRRYLLRFRAVFTDNVARKEKNVLLIVDDDHDE